MKDTKVAWNPSYSELIVIVRNRSSYRVPTVAKRLASLVYFNTAGSFLFCLQLYQPNALAADSNRRPSVAQLERWDL